MNDDFTKPAKRDDRVIRPASSSLPRAVSKIESNIYPIIITHKTLSRCISLRDRLFINLLLLARVY